MDKAAIFADVTRRNALRKANGLPLLDVPAEYAHEVSLSYQREYQEVCNSHADEREAIRSIVLSEFQQKYGADFGRTMGGRWAIGQVTRKRFAGLMADKYALPAPDRVVGKNEVTYGGSVRALTSGDDSADQPKPR
jgi:hypothetical protein